MNTENEIIVLAETKLKAAKVLLVNGYPDDAYYLGGYSFELLLKAKICKTLQVPNFFDFDNNNIKRAATSSYKVHDYEQLILLSGLFKEFEAKKKEKDFFADWSKISSWNENVRYVIGRDIDDVRKFFSSLENMMVWLKQNL